MAASQHPWATRTPKWSELGQGDLASRTRATHAARNVFAACEHWRRPAGCQRECATTLTPPHARAMPFSRPSPSAEDWPWRPWFALIPASTTTARDREPTAALNLEPGSEPTI